MATNPQFPAGRLITTSSPLSGRCRRRRQRGLVDGRATINKTPIAQSKRTSAATIASAAVPRQNELQPALEQ
jgi:hypothetical protein